MDKEKHQKRHLMLHTALDELLADYITHGEGSIKNSIFALVAWSCSQTLKPDHEDSK